MYVFILLTTEIKSSGCQIGKRRGKKKFSAPTMWLKIEIWLTNQSSTERNMQKECAG